MNKKYSHCCILNKAHKLTEDKVSGLMCFCRHPCMCEGKKRQSSRRISSVELKAED